MDGRKALVVGRDPAWPAVLKSVVGEEWEQESYGSCREALDALARANRGGGAPDFILVDNAMPDMDGLTFLTALPEWVGVLPPAVLCTDGPLDEVSYERIEKLSLLEVLPKPLRPEDLQKALAPLLWVAGGGFLTVAEFLGMAQRQSQTGLFQLQASHLRFSVELRRGRLLQLFSQVFHERWRSSLISRGVTLPSQNPSWSVDLMRLEGSLPGSEDLQRAKEQAVLSFLAATPEAEGVAVRKVRPSAQTATLLEVPLHRLIGALVQHGSASRLGALASEGLALVVGPGVGTAKDFPLTPQHGYLLSLCQTPISFRDILGTGILPEAQLLKECYFLVLLGLLATRPAVPEPFSLATLSAMLEEEARRIRLQKEGIRNLAQSLSLTGKSPYEILGVSSAATHSEILGSFEALRTQIAPERLHPRVSKEMERDIGFIQAKVGEAILLIQAQWLQDGHQRVQEASKELDQKNIRRIGADKTGVQQVNEARAAEAQRLFLKAKEMMAEEEYHQASQYIKLALFYNPLSAPFHHLEGKLLSLMTASKAKHAAEKALLRAIELDAFSVEYRLDLAQLYLKLKLFQRCRGQLDRAHALDPKNPRLADLRRDLKEKERG